MVAEEDGKMTKKYEQMHSDIVELLTTNGMHATMVGKIINLGGTPEADLKAALEMADYVVGLAQKAEERRKNSVKNATRHTK